MADVNSPLGNKDMGIFMAETCLHDLIGQKYGIKNINSHISGSTQIDFILSTTKIVEAMIRGGILPFHNTIISDHRGMHVDINWRILFIGETYIPEDKQIKKVKSRNKKSRKKFREKLSDGFINGDIIRRSTEILQQVKYMDKEE
eukprot:465190-Ditylum_brightwellii.AAC.1